MFQSHIRAKGNSDACIARALCCTQMFQSHIRAKGNSDTVLFVAREACGRCFNPTFGLKAIPTHRSTRIFSRGNSGFNPTFGLKAIPTQHTASRRQCERGFNPTFGLKAIPTLPMDADSRNEFMFQSHIRAKGNSDPAAPVTSILLAPSFNPTFGLKAIPTWGICLSGSRQTCFNPTFGLKAIPTKDAAAMLLVNHDVSIPHSG